MNTNNVNKKICKYGDKCYRKNEDHLKNYDHESQAQTEVFDENTCPESTNNSNDSNQQIIQSKKDDLKSHQTPTDPLESTIKKIEILVEKFNLDEMKGKLKRLNSFF